MAQKPKSQPVTLPATTPPVPLAFVQEQDFAARQYRGRRENQEDYYAFADQDDIWNPEKLEWAVDRLEAKKIQILAEGKKWESTPLLYTSSYD